MQVATSLAERGRRVEGDAEGAAPERGGCVEVAGPAVDDETGEAAAVSAPQSTQMAVVVLATEPIVCGMGQTVRIQFRGTNDITLPTSFRIDDVTVQ